MEKTEIQQLLLQASQLEAEGKLEEALQCCQVVIQKDRNLAEAFNLQGLVLEQLGRQDEAFASWREALLIDPDDKDARENLNEAKAELTEPLRRRLSDSARVGLVCGLAFALISLVLGLPSVVLALMSSESAGGAALAIQWGANLLVILLLGGAFAGAVAWLSYPRVTDWARYIWLGAVIGILTHLLNLAIPISVLIVIGDWVSRLGVSIRPAIAGAGLGLAIAIAMRASFKQIVLLVIGSGLAVGLGTFFSYRLILNYLWIHYSGQMQSITSPLVFIDWALRAILTYFIGGLVVGGLHQYFYSMNMESDDENDEEDSPNDEVSQDTPSLKMLLL